MLDLIAARASRGTPCAPPCAWCGGDGSGVLLRGATLHPSPTLDPSKPLERVGAWMLLPPSVNSLRVVLSGDALNTGRIAPTAIRIRTKTSSAQPFWRGAALSELTVDDTRYLSARLHDLDASVDDLRVIELAGLCRAEGTASLEMRFVAEGSSCLVCRATVSIGAPAPALHGLVATAELSHAQQASALARFIDALVARVRACGHNPSRLALRAAHCARGTLVASVECGPCGLTGSAWRSALQLVARGRCASLSLEDPTHPDALGIEVAPRVRGRAEPLEITAWMHASAMSPGGPSRWHEPPADAPFSTRTARWREPMYPRLCHLVEIAGESVYPPAPSRGARSD